MNRDPGDAGVNFWINALKNGSMTRERLSLSIVAGALVNTTPQGLAAALTFQ